MHRIRKHLSYANVMSSIAVFLVLGGVAVAATQLPKNSVGTKQLKKNAVNSAKVRNHSLKAVDFKAGQLPAGPQGEKGETGAPGQSATKLWAVINSNGTIARSSGTTGSHQIFTGEYEVDFNQDVSKCAFEATVAGAFGFIEAEPRSAVPDGVWVATGGTTGSFADRNFNLAVFC